MLNIHQLALQNYNDSIEIDEKFFIKNIDTGETYDARKDDSYRNICEKIYKNPKFTEKAWQEYWREVRKFRENLWNFSEKGDDISLIKLLNQIKTSYYPVDINDRTLNKWSALHFAAEENHTKIIDILLKNNADIEAMTKFGRTPLHLASLKGLIDSVKLLLDYGANVNSLDQELNTPLHLAAENNFLETIELLLKKKALINKKNYQGMTPYDLCLDIKARKIFEEYGINELDELNYGRTFIGTTVLNNSRADYVGRFLFLGQKNRALIQPNLLENNNNDQVNFNDVNLFQIDKNYQAENIQKKYEPMMANIEEVKEEEPAKNKIKLEEKQFPLSKSSKNVPEFQKNQVDFSGKSKPSSFRSFLSIFSSTTKDPMLDGKISCDDFIFYKMLGKGSFGEVYLVRLKLNDQLYAMKVLAKDKVFSQNLIKYVKSERNILSLMSHPFIVRLYFAFQNEKRLFLILEYCSGGDLGKVLSRKRRFPEEIVRIYISEIILAIENLHSKNILFRDLKPDNVVIDSKGHALLTDFGLSKQGIMDNNLAKSFCGSVAYLAPEMLAKVGHNKNIDWYLVGVLFYELLVGIPPFFSKNREEMFNNIKSGPLLIPKNLSFEAKDLMKKLLTRNPKNRLGSKNGSEEIKNHEFFKNLNWDDVLKKKLNPPLPDIKEFELNPMENPPFLDEKPIEKLSKKSMEQKYIEGWSYENKKLY